jgi:hypothetical protein
MFLVYKFSNKWFTHERLALFFIIRIQFAPHRKHHVSASKPNRLMSYAEVINALRIESGSELHNDWRFTSNQFVFAPSSLRLTTSDFFPAEPLRSWCFCNIHSDERMGLSFTFTSDTHQRCLSRVRVPRDSRSYFTVWDSSFSPTWRTRSPYLYPLGTGWTSY